MAKIGDDAIFGGLSGKIGPVVVVRNGSKTYIRSRPYRGKVKSAATKSQNKAFKITLGYLKRLKPLFNQTMQLGRPEKGWHRAMSINLNRVTEVVDGDPVLLPERVCISSGLLVGVGDTAMTFDQKNIRVTWSPDKDYYPTDGMYSELLMGRSFSTGRNQDRLTLVAYFPTCGIYNLGYAHRRDGVASLEVHEFMDTSVIDVFVFLSNPESSVYSFSQFVGKIRRS